MKYKLKREIRDLINEEFAPWKKELRGDIAASHDVGFRDSKESYSLTTYYKTGELIQMILDYLGLEPRYTASRTDLKPKVKEKE